MYGVSATMRRQREGGEEDDEEEKEYCYHHYHMYRREGIQEGRMERQMNIQNIKTTKIMKCYNLYVMMLCCVASCRVVPYFACLHICIYHLGMHDTKGGAHVCVVCGGKYMGLIVNTTGERGRSKRARIKRGYM